MNSPEGGECLIEVVVVVGREILCGLGVSLSYRDLSNLLLQDFIFPVCKMRKWEWGRCGIVGEYSMLCGLCRAPPAI